MAKCEFCGEEVVLPFQCSFCGRYFCVEHRLPENHLCLRSPPRTPLGSWKAKVPKKEGKRPIYAKARIQKIGTKLGFGIGTILRVLLGIPIVFGGLIIILWEIYPSLISSLPIPLTFQIIDTVASFPLPSLFTGVCISLVGVLVLLTKAKAFFLSLMFVVAFAYPFGLDWAFSVNFGEGLVAYIPIAFVLAMCHELLHAMAWWSFGYFAIPIPILIPPILGITIGEKPRRWRENFFVSVAPILLTITSFLLYCTTNDERYSMFGIINLAGMVYDMISIFVW